MLFFDTRTPSSPPAADWSHTPAPNEAFGAHESTVLFTSEPVAPSGEEDAHAGRLRDDRSVDVGVRVAEIGSIGASPAHHHDGVADPDFASMTPEMVTSSIVAVELATRMPISPQPLMDTSRTVTGAVASSSRTAPWPSTPWMST